MPYLFYTPWGAVIGAMFGIPLSYFFQSGLVRAIIPMSAYLEKIPEILDSRDEVNSTFWVAIIVCAMAGSLAGFFLDAITKSSKRGGKGDPPGGSN